MHTEWEVKEEEEEEKFSNVGFRKPLHEKEIKIKFKC